MDNAEIIQQVREKGCNCNPDVEIVDRVQRMANVRHDDWCAIWGVPQTGDLTDYALAEARRAGCNCANPPVELRTNDQGEVGLWVIHAISCAIVARNN